MEDNEITFDFEEYVQQMAAVVGLSLKPEHRPGVIDHFVRTAAIARLVLDFPLPADTESAPVFQP
jgi:Protein of unknown function (DUF4089)